MVSVEINEPGHRIFNNPGMTHCSPVCPLSHLILRFVHRFFGLDKTGNCTCNVNHFQGDFKDRLLWLEGDFGKRP